MHNLADIVKRFSGKKVLVVGDIMLDEFIFGDTNRINPEAPVPVVLVRRKEFRLGGAANAAANLAALGAQVTLISQIGNDETGKILTQLLDVAQIKHVLVARDDMITIKKTRIVARNQQVVRFDEELICPPSIEALKKTILATSSVPADAILLSDYNKGFVVKEIVDTLKSRDVPLFADVKSAHAEFVKEAFAVVPNIHEAIQFAGSGTPEEIVAKISCALNTNAIVKLGDRGAIVHAKDSKTSFYVPTKKRAVHDVTGAGDTFISGLILAHLAGAKLEECVIIANETAGIAVEKSGTAIVQQEELFASLNQKNNKIVSKEELLIKVRDLKKEGRKVVFTNGCFDILHARHIRILSRAKDFGDVLILALNSDASIHKLKGEGRPVNTEQERAEVLAGLGIVDYVVIFDEESPISLIDALRPEFFVKGNSVSEAGKKEIDLVNSYGGQFVLTGSLSDTSTTKTIEKIRQN